MILEIPRFVALEELVTTILEEDLSYAIIIRAYLEVIGGTLSRLYEKVEEHTKELVVV